MVTQLQILNILLFSQLQSNKGRVTTSGTYVPPKTQPKQPSTVSVVAVAPRITSETSSTLTQIPPKLEQVSTSGVFVPPENGGKRYMQSLM